MQSTLPPSCTSADKKVASTTSKTMSANNTTAAVPIFRITGSVFVTKLYGIVTTVLGANHTAVSYRLNDQTAQVYITLLAGTVASAAPVGTIIEKNALAATAVDVDSSAAGLFEELAVANDSYYQNFRLTQKTGGVNTDIEYKYTTTDAPTSGAIQFFCEYQPISADGAVTPL